MEKKEIIIFNNVLHYLSNSIQKYSKDQAISDIRKLYSTDEFLSANKTILASLPVDKSTRHARRVKNSDPIIALYDCYQLLNDANLPFILRIYPIKDEVENIGHSKIEKNIHKTDYEELKNEQNVIKDHLSSIFKSVDELKYQLKLINKTTSLFKNNCLKKNLAIKINKPMHINSKSPKSNKTGLPYLQKLIDEDVENLEKNGETIKLFEASDDESDDFEGYSNSSTQEMYPDAEISLVDNSSFKEIVDDQRTTESSIEIISEYNRDDIQLRNIKNNSKEIILNARDNEEKNLIPVITVVNSSQSDLSESFSCALCGAVYETEDKLIKHVATHRSGSPLICTFCQFTCISVKAMKKHLNCNHSDITITPRKKRIFKCVYCGIEYQSNESMQAHIQNHYEEKNNCFECQMCFVQFPSRLQLSRHKKMEHASSCPYQCDICGARFSFKLYLHNHRRTHASVKPHACSFCNQRFINRSKLTLHERTHTGEKPFKCPHCEYRSSRQDNMKYHINSRHINRTNTKCMRCDMKFPTGELENHLALHSTVLPYQCLECNRMFKSLGGLRVHYKSSQVHNKRI